MVLEAYLQHLPEPLDRCIFTYIDRIGLAPVCGQNLTQCADSLVAQTGKLSSLRYQGVGGHDAGSTSVRYYRQVWASGSGLHRKNLRAVEQVSDLFDADDAHPPEGSIVDGVFSRDRSCVRCCRHSALRGLSRLDHDDRFSAGEPSRCAHEFSGVLYRLDEENYAPSLRVDSEVVYQVCEVHVYHVADGNEVAESNIRLRRPVEDGRAECPTLRYKGDPTGLGHLVCKCCVQLCTWTNDTQTVRPDNPEVIVLL